METSAMKKVAYCFGTRPEVIKLSLLINESKKFFDVSTIFTGQHTSLFDDVSHLIEKPTFSYDLGVGNTLNQIASKLYSNIEKSLKIIKPDVLVVHGDTISAYISANVAFYMGIEVAHVEAGLRSGNTMSPFPEEFHRQSIDKISKYCFCPTELSYDNLANEGIDKENLYITGNTIVDVVDKIKPSNLERSDYVILTLHRRENEDKFNTILEQVDEYAKNSKVIFPVHPNPIIRDKINENTNGNITIVDPMKYEKFINLLANCRFIVSDSGGIQEEAISLNKKVLVCRDSTERPEGVKMGACKIVGDDILNNIGWAESELKFSHNPFGSPNGKKVYDEIIEVLLK